MKYQLLIVALWAIAIGATLAIADMHSARVLLPVYFVCMMGCNFVIRLARK
jgi:hypothetical protein